jgi:gluconolactonase
MSRLVRSLASSHPSPRRPPSRRTPRRRRRSARRGSRIERLDPAFDALVARDAQSSSSRRDSTGPRGPCGRSAGGYLLFSDIPKNTVYKWKEARGSRSSCVRRATRGHQPAGREIGTNGLTFDAQGTLVVADHGNRGISRWNDSLFTRTVVVDRFEGKRFNSPNDLVWGPNGDLYFTDPSYGLRRSERRSRQGAAVQRRVPALGGGQLSTRDARSHLPERHRALAGRADALRRDLGRKNPYIMAYAVNADGSTGRGASSTTRAPACSRAQGGWTD